MNNQNQSVKIWAGLITLYLVWGSTYLGIRFVVASVPAIMASGFRNFFAGAILLTFALLSGKFKKPTPEMLKTTVLSGLMMLTVGNSLFTISAKWVPSSYSALFSASGPVMLIILLWLMNKEKPQPKVMLGAILGMVGVGILMSLKTMAIAGFEDYYLLGITFLFIAVLCWNIGVVVVSKSDLAQYHASQIAGTQMLVGGTISLIISYFMKEFDNFHVQNVSHKALWSFAYILTFGSVIAFLVFNWLSKVTTPTLVATYTYVNPLVAMILGGLFAGEHLHPLMMLSGAIIITAVILITSVERKSQR
ncbi:MAG: EamA family transporter [Arcicella sp.]|jgi:drug/metabolite transporter (DMT)-like permease|nr:EamA family transporter [Arcicella sp.]